MHISNLNVESRQNVSIGNCHPFYMFVWNKVYIFRFFFFQLIAKGKSIFAQQVEKMKGTGATTETMMDLHEKNQQTDFEDLNHNFGKKSGHIICIVILICIICD
jgi:hypothetical protein